MPQEKHFLTVKFSAHVTPGDMEHWHPAFSAYGTVTKTDEHTYCVEVQRNSKYTGLQVILGGLERSGTAHWAEISEQQMREIRALAGPHDAMPQIEVAEVSGTSPQSTVEENNPIRRKLTAAQKRALKAAKLRHFVQQYGRSASPGCDPNDRGYDRELEQKVKRMPSDQLDRLLREDED